jgi:hypothetical protein
VAALYVSGAALGWMSVVVDETALLGGEPPPLVETMMTMIKTSSATETANVRRRRR